MIFSLKALLKTVLHGPSVFCDCSLFLNDKPLSSLSRASTPRGWELGWVSAHTLLRAGFRWGWDFPWRRVHVSGWTQPGNRTGLSIRQGWPELAEAVQEEWVCRRG